MKRKHRKGVIMKKKSHMLALVALTLAVCTVITGCDGKNNKPENSSGAQQPPAYQISKDIYINPIPVDKDSDVMTDDEISDIANRLFANCNNIWFSLYYGIPTIVLDESKVCSYDGDTWFKVVFVSSFEEYKNIVDSSFEYKAYTDFVYPAIEHNMHEENGILYHCRERAGDGSPPPQIAPLKITVEEKKSDKITLKVMVEEASFSPKDGVLVPEKGEKIYTILKQGGYWVLESFYGETVGENNSELPKFEDTITPKETC